MIVLSDGLVLSLKKSADNGLSEAEHATIEKVRNSIISKIIDSFYYERIPFLGAEFSVFDYSREGKLGLTKELIGIYLGMFVKEGMVKDNYTLNKLLSFSIEIENGYFKNPYHSFQHAVDVAYMSYYILKDLGVMEQANLFKLDFASILLAALGHDVQHPGLNNQYQVNFLLILKISINSEVAVKYDGISILENQSSEYTRKIILKHNFIDGLVFSDEMHYSMDEGRENAILKIVHDCIIKTDMFYHFKLLEKLVEFEDNGTFISGLRNTSQSSLASLQSIHIRSPGEEKTTNPMTVPGSNLSNVLHNAASSDHMQQNYFSPQLGTSRNHIASSSRELNVFNSPKLSNRDMYVHSKQLSFPTTVGYRRNLNPTSSNTSLSGTPKIYSLESQLQCSFKGGQLKQQQIYDSHNDSSTSLRSDSRVFPQETIRQDLLNIILHAAGKIII